MTLALPAGTRRAAVQLALGGCLALGGVPGALPAQAATKALTLRAIDATSGEGVAGASVRVEGPVSLEDVTGADGTWRSGLLPGGAYAITVAHVGFATQSRKVELGSDEPAAPESSARVTLCLTPRPVSLEALVITSSRRLQRLADAPVTTELVSAREIEETGASDLAAVLTERTGIELSGGHPVGSGLMIHGMDSERVLLLVDGQPFIGRISGAIDVSRIPASMVERVEIVKGPQSTLYGSEAMGGVVNVVTRRPDAGAPAGWEASTSLTIGSEGRVDAGVSSDFVLGRVRGAIDVGRRAIEVTPGLDGAGDGSLTERRDARADLDWEAGEDLRLRAGGFLIDEDQRWRGGQIYSFADNTQWSGRLGAAWTRGPHTLTPTVTATAFDHLSRSATSEDPLPGTGERETQRLVEGEVLYGLDLGENALDAGIELRRDVIDSERIRGGSRSERTFESFAQASLSLGELTLVPGVRLTASDPWGTHWTPRVAALYRPLPELALRVSAGQGFRAPNFKERYMEFLNVGPGFGYTVRGNPDLDPEVSRNLTAGVEWAGERVYARAQLYDNRFDRFIETRAVGDSSGITVYTYGNVDDGFTRGAELEAGLTRGRWRFEAGYGRLRAERADTGAPLLGRPRSSARFTLGHARPDGLRGSWSGVYTGRTPMARADDGTTQYRDAFLRFDARVAASLPLDLELAVGVDNVFDQTSEEWPGFTGRHVYTAVTWHFPSPGT